MKLGDHRLDSTRARIIISDECLWEKMFSLKPRRISETDLSTSPVTASPRNRKLYDRGHCCSGSSQKAKQRRTRTRTKRTTQHEQENQEPTTAMSEAPRGGTIPGQETTTREAHKSEALKCPTCTSEDTIFTTGEQGERIPVCYVS